MPRPVMVRAVLAGVALGVLVFASGSLILYQAGGVLPAAGGLVATLSAALAAGLWAGAPGPPAGSPPTWRWVGAGVSLAVAGIFGTAWQGVGGERFGGMGRALALLFLVGIPVYAIGFLLPALAAWAARPADDAAPAPGAGDGIVLGVLGGAAVGASLAGLFLLPDLAPGPLLLGVGALLTFPLFFPMHAAAAPDSAEEVLHEEETAFGTLRVARLVHPGEQRQPEVRLYVNDEIESGEQERSGAPTFAYVAAAERWLLEGAPRGAAYLFLGGGAYTLPRRIAEDDPSAAVTVVELDPAVTRAAYRWFGVKPEHGIVSLHGDARAVAQGLEPGAYDRVFLDVYDGTEAVPHHLVTVEALALLGGLLRPGGELLVNLIGVARGEGECRLWSTVRTAARAFPSVALYAHLGRDFPERQNFLLAAAAEPGVSFPARAGLFEPWPAAEWPEIACATVYRDRQGQNEAAPPAGGRGGRAATAAAD
ncbi:MAG TPA: fused MFS/spermidine synthase [Longimicrobium sp.]|nr:fused MFS/spermidine synthase [Longimicrobium sp.]